MRGGLIIVAIIFWLSVRFEFPEQMTFGGECEVSQSGRYLKRDYTTVFAGLLNRGDDRSGKFSILKENPFHYFATEGDTTRLADFDDSSFDPLRHIDFEKTFQSMSVFDKESIRYMLSQHWDSTERFLMEVHDVDLDYIGEAQILEVQLDFDPETERIVQVEHGWRHTYFFYEAYGSYWQCVDQFWLGNKGPLTTPDFSLDGFVGLSQTGTGTGLYSRDVTYFYMSGGVLYHAFTINQEVSNTNLALDTSGREFIFHSESHPMMVNASEIFVEHEIKMTAYNYENDSLSESIFEETISYSLVQQPDGQFKPNKTFVGFNPIGCDGDCDSTYFLPEVYGFDQLTRLESEGTARQKQLVKNLLIRCDSTCTFR